MLNKYFVHINKLIYFKRKPISYQNTQIEGSCIQAMKSSRAIGLMLVAFIITGKNKTSNGITTN